MGGGIPSEQVGMLYQVLLCTATLHISLLLPSLNSMLACGASTGNQQVDVLLALLFRPAGALVRQHPLVQQRRQHRRDVRLREQLAAHIQQALRQVPFLRTRCLCFASQPGAWSTSRAQALCKACLPGTCTVREPAERDGVRARLCKVWR